MASNPNHRVVYYYVLEVMVQQGQLEEPALGAVPGPGNWTDAYHPPLPGEERSFNLEEMAQMDTLDDDEDAFENTSNAADGVPMEPDHLEVQELQSSMYSSSADQVVPQVPVAVFSREVHLFDMQISHRPVDPSYSLPSRLQAEAAEGSNEPTGERNVNIEGVEVEE